VRSRVRTAKINSFVIFMGSIERLGIDRNSICTNHMKFYQGVARQLIIKVANFWWSTFGVHPINFDLPSKSQSE
jgi:hypothetical protein